MNVNKKRTMEKLSVAALVAAVFCNLNVVAAVKVSERFGWNPDDATANLQAALDSGLKEIVVDKQSGPWVVKPLFARSNQRIVFERGTVLLAKRGEYLDRRDCLFKIENAKNVEIVGYGAEFRMWKDDYAKGPGYRRGEWRHTLTIASSENVRISGLLLSESGGDGIYITGPNTEKNSKNISIVDCVMDRHHRQGMSIISVENLLVENCVFSNTKGVAPQDGLDIEPNRAAQCAVNCVFRNCISKNNAGNGYEVALSHSRSSTKPCSIVFENCTTTGDFHAFKVRTRVKPAEGNWPKGIVEMRGCKLENTRGFPVMISQNPKGALDVALADCTIDTPGTDDPETGLFLLSPFYSDDPKSALPKVSGLKMINCASRPYAVHDSMFRDVDGNPTGFSFVEPDFSSATVVDSAPGRFSSASRLRIRNHVRFAVYADRARTVSLKCAQVKVGRRERPAAKTCFKVTDASGRVIAEPALPGYDSGTVSFAAPAKGFYFMEASFEKSSIEFRGADAPVAVDTRLWGARAKPLNLFKTGGSVYVPLAAGQKGDVRVSGSVPAERVSVKVFDPEGKCVATDTKVLHWKSFPVEASGKNGLWKFTFGKPSYRDFEDYAVAVHGVSPFVFLSPDKYWYSGIKK